MARMNAVLLASVVLLAAWVAAAASAAAPKPAETAMGGAPKAGARRFPATIASLSDKSIQSGTALKALIDNRFTLFTLLANASGLVAPLNSTYTKATIFAPTDEAIKKLASDFKATPQELLQHQMLVDRLVGQHIVVNRSLSAADLKTGPLEAVRGELLVNKSGGSVVLTGPQNSAKVVKPNIKAGDVTIHGVDAVLLPDDVFTNLQHALTYRRVTKVLNDLLAKDPQLAKIIADPTTNVTLLVPTSDALNRSLADGAVAKLVSDPKALGALLRYHIVDGFRIFPNEVAASEKLKTLDAGHYIELKKVVTGGVGHIYLTSDRKGAKPAKVVKFNIVAGRSIIHLVDGMLIPAM